MKLDLTKTKEIVTLVRCNADGELMPFTDCLKCASFICMLKGKMMCLVEVDGFEKETQDEWWNNLSKPED